MECSICLNAISSPTKFRSDCKHCFHEECIKEWIRHDKKSCPMCRTIINPKTIEKLIGVVKEKEPAKVNHEFIVASMDDLQAILGNLSRINTN